MSEVSLSKVFEKSVFIDLEVSGKADLLEKLVEGTCKSNRIPTKLRPAILGGVLAREELGSTGVGYGIAIPHAKVEGVTRLIGGFARTASPVDYGAVDGDPVRLAFLLVAPKEGVPEYMSVLARISTGVRIKKFRNFLLAATSKEEVLGILDEMSDYDEDG